MGGENRTARLEQAIELHQAGRQAEAEAIYLRLLREQPNDADALHFLGLLRAHESRDLEAIELMQRSLKILPNNPHAWNNLANLLLAVGHEDEAEVAYTRATDLNPDLAQAFFNLGQLFRRKKRTEDAIKAYRKAIDSNPMLVRAYESLALLFYRVGNAQRAGDTYRQWLEVDPGNPVAKHMAAATSGVNVPERAGDQYVSEHFDDFAESFDENLKNLGYAAPQLLAAALADRVRFSEGALDILDAGCGTGLCGLLLRSSAKKLVGVDLSAGMLAKAREREIYDQLIESELCACMRAHPAAFDVINCADTLVYFGALEEALSAARASLRPGGIFAFTLEAEPADSTERYRIQVHGRYTHGAGYVREAVRQAGFAEAEIEGVVLRKERGAEVKGHLVVARLPT